jgi:FkbM family methyltransferase
MIKEYLRHSGIFRSIFGPLLLLVRKVRSFGTELASQHYRDVVVGGTLMVSPKNIPGIFEIDAKSDIAARVVINGSYEPEVTTLLDRLTLKAGVIVNVGANVGFYSIYLARGFPGALRVVAVEPNPEAFRHLKVNIERNDMSHRIEAAQVCVGDSEGEIELSVIEGMPEYSSIGGIAHPSVSDRTQFKVRVPIRPLAAVLRGDPVCFIFVDTEGAEQLVFKGARAVLLRDKPLLLFECSDTLLRKFGSSTMELESTLNDFGYVVKNALCPRLSLQHPYEGEAIAFHLDDLKNGSSGCDPVGTKSGTS